VTTKYNTIVRKCERFHQTESKIGQKHRKFKKRIYITAYRRRMGDFDEGSSLKEHYEIDADRKGDWGIVGLSGGKIGSWYNTIANSTDGFKTPSYS